MSGPRGILLICLAFSSPFLGGQLSNAQDELRDQHWPSVMPLGTIDGELPDDESIPEISEDDQDLFGFGTSPEGIRAFLQSFQSHDDEATREHLKDLASPDYSTRHKALVQLINDPVPNRGLITEALKSADLNLRILVAQVLSLNSAERAHARITLGFRTIIEKEFPGLAPDLVNTVSNLSINNESILKLCTQAFDLTLIPEDAPFLKEKLKSQQPLVRYLAVRGLITLKEQSALPLVIPLIEDPYDETCYLVTQFAASHQHQDCLKGYVQLLTSEKFAYRWQSLERLRRLTGQDFGYYPAGEEEERIEAAATWKQWIEQQGDKLQIDFESLGSARNQ